MTAAPYVWKLIQAFYAQFPQYESRDFGIFTESYGGHYGPEFAEYFLEQNTKINSGSIKGEKIDLVALGVNNAWIDAEIQELAYVDYSYNNTYKPLITASQHTQYTNIYKTKCKPALQKCKSTGANADCKSADTICYNNIEGPLSQVGDFNVYDIRVPSNDPNPPETYMTYLQSPSVMKAIGAQSKYQECPNAPYQQFSSTGDSMLLFSPCCLV